MFKILIAEAAHNILIEKLSKEGFTCDYKPNIELFELGQIIKNYQGLVIRSKFIIDENFIDKTENLKFIARAGSGMENINVEYSEKKGIVCFNSPEGNRDSVGEHTLGLILSLLHKIQISDNEVKKGIWNRISNIGNELCEKTVGILGYGNMGSAFAQRLNGFETNVIAYDKYKSGFSDEYVKEVEYEEFYKHTDILSIHIPLTEETKFMINDQYINNFEKNIYIINTARGKIIKTCDLVKNLKSGKITGAALDVLEYEKTHFESIFSNEESSDFNYLINSKNVILTPHVAGSSNASYRKIAEVLAEKISNKFYCTNLI